MDVNLTQVNKLSSSLSQSNFNEKIIFSSWKQVNKHSKIRANKLTE